MNNRDRKLFVLALKTIVRMLSHILYANLYSERTRNTHTEFMRGKRILTEAIRQYEKQEIL